MRSQGLGFYREPRRAEPNGASGSEVSRKEPSSAERRERLRVQPKATELRRTERAAPSRTPLKSRMQPKAADNSRAPPSAEFRGRAGGRGGLGTEPGRARDGAGAGSGRSRGGLGTEPGRARDGAGAGSGRSRRSGRIPRLPLPPSLSLPLPLSSTARPPSLPFPIPCHPSSPPAPHFLLSPAAAGLGVPENKAQRAIKMEPMTTKEIEEREAAPFLLLSAFELGGICLHLWF
ncbi:CCR4-NOT transcription complex subunit 3-like [Serinus canaria]|uniref:CCR4-NOT transcription complex subunit 3-like n=1 Tax=Serinus canaria TaxID=9135 RepID=UPI0021CC617C|nr:CCR4-NOT transcription complex subunit 3-like [Serinus canaria]